MNSIDECLIRTKVFSIQCIAIRISLHQYIQPIDDDDKNDNDDDNVEVTVMKLTKEFVRY